MQKVIKVSSIFLFLVACGPSHEDEVAAKNACHLVERYEEMQAAKGTDREVITQEFFTSTLEDYVSIQAPRSSAQNVKELMEESCDGKVELFEQIIQGK